MEERDEKREGGKGRGGEEEGEGGKREGEASLLVNTEREASPRAGRASGGFEHVTRCKEWSEEASNASGGERQSHWGSRVCVSNDGMNRGGNWLV